MNNRITLRFLNLSFHCNHLVSFKNTDTSVLPLRDKGFTCLGVARAFGGFKHQQVFLMCRQICDSILIVLRKALGFEQGKSKDLWVYESSDRTICKPDELVCHLLGERVRVSTCRWITTWDILQASEMGPWPVRSWVFLNLTLTPGCHSSLSRLLTHEQLMSWIWQVSADFSMLNHSWL